MKSKASILIFSFALLFAGNARAAALPIYITQVQITGGAGKTDDDFIELFNPNTTAVNLKGYRLVKRAQNSQSDELIKSWTSDSSIPPKSFYLWANSSYVSINPKADVVTSATISNDNGVALRFGADNAGQLIDAFSWGKANNGFKTATAVNPGPGQAIFRKDWYATSTAYFIAASKPYNSSTTDVTAAFAQSREKALATSSPRPAMAQNVPATTGDAGVVNPSAPGANQQTPQPSYASFADNQNNTKAASGKNYLILASGALLAVIFLAWKFFFRGRK